MQQGIRTRRVAPSPAKASRALPPVFYLAVRSYEHAMSDLPHASLALQPHKENISRPIFQRITARSLTRTGNPGLWALCANCRDLEFPKHKSLRQSGTGTQGWLPPAGFSPTLPSQHGRPRTQECMWRSCWLDPLPDCGLDNSSQYAEDSKTVGKHSCSIVIITAVRYRRTLLWPDDQISQGRRKNSSESCSCVSGVGQGAYGAETKALRG